MSHENTYHYVGNWVLNGTLFLSFAITMAIVIQQLSTPLSSGIYFF